MRKLCFTVIVLSLAIAANAGTVDVVISGLNGQPITPVKEITVTTIDVVSLDIVYDSQPGWSLWELGGVIYVQGAGRIDISTITKPAGYWNNELSVITVQPDGVWIDFIASDVGTVPPGIILDHFLYYCESEGNVLISIGDFNGVDGPYSIETDGNDLYPVNNGPGVVIHYTFPPCWDCPGQTFGNTNGDYCINSTDYFNFKKAYGTGFNTHPHGTSVWQYNCCCDFNHDGKVNAMDYFILKQFFGKCWLSMCSTLTCQ